MLRVACQQLALDVARPRANRLKSLTAIKEALDAGAGVVVLSELVTSGYVFSSEDEVRARALVADERSFQDWREEIGERDALVVGGFPELGDDGLLYNTVALVGREGLLATYRKTHLWDEEKRWFTPGAAAPPVVATRHGLMGLLICYDLEFPEMARSLALRGAELILVPTNWPRTRHPQGERPDVMGNAMVMARLNRVFIACCDRVGVERGVDWNGGTCVVDVDGWVLAEREHRDEGMIVADIDLDRARDKALTERNDVLGDRRPVLYSTLTDDVVGQSVSGKNFLS